MKLIAAVIATFSFWIFGLVSTFLIFIPAMVAAVFDPSGDSTHRCAQIWGRVLVRLGFTRVKVINREMCDRVENPVIWMSNHTSFFDIYTFLGFVPGQYRIVSKKEIFSVPMVGTAMKRMGYISIDAENPKRAAEALKQSGESIRGGKSVLIYPEGVRSTTGQLQNFRRGAFKLAKEARVPIAIVRLSGALQVMPPFQKFSVVHPGTITLEYVDIVPKETVESLSERELMQHVHKIMGRGQNSERSS